MCQPLQKGTMTEEIAALDPDDRVDPVLVVLDFPVRQQPAIERERGIDRPRAGAGQEVEKALLALEHAIGEAEGADEGFAFDPDLVEQDTPRRIPIAVDVRIDDVGIAAEFLKTELEC